MVRNTPNFDQFLPLRSGTAILSIRTIKSIGAITTLEIALPFSFGLTAGINGEKSGPKKKIITPEIPPTGKKKKQTC